MIFQYLDTIRQYTHENLKLLTHAPSVQMHDILPDINNIDDVNDDLDPDIRNHQAEIDSRVEPVNEFYDGDKDNDNDNDKDDGFLDV